MTVEEIERLLAEFYEGNTNEQEEELLKEAFRTEEVPEHLQKDKKLFLSFFPGKVVDNVPAGLEDKLSRMIDEKAEEEQRFFHRNKAKRNWRWIGGIAATILVLVGVGYGITNMGEDMRPPTPQDTFSDPEAAYKALQATLIEVSANLNKGIEQIEETRIDVTKVNQEVRKEIQQESDMKTMKIILAGVLLMLPLLCQAQKNLFNKYGDMKGVSSVYISKAMIETNPNLFTKDVYIGKVSGQLNSVQVLSTMDNNVKKEMRKDLRSLVQSSRYELLMKQKGTVSSSEFYMSRKGEKVKELIMIVDGAATLKFVYLEGDMTLKDIQNIMMYQNTSWNGNNVNIQLPDINWAEIEKLKNRDWLGELKHSQELALKGLENVAKLKDNKYLKEQMDTDTWKRFEKSMEALEERLEKME